MPVTIPAGDPAEAAKVAVAEFKAMADADAGDLTNAKAWLEAEMVTLAATMGNSDQAQDNFRLHQDAIATALDNFHRTYVYTP